MRNMQSPSLITLNLAASLLCLVLAMGHLIPSYAQASYIAAGVDESQPYLIEKDPPLGDVAALLPMVARTTGDSTLIAMVVSDCSSCNDERFKSLNSLAVDESTTKFVFVLYENRDQRLLDRKRQYSDIFFSRVPDGFATAWDAVFLPRTYAIGRAGRFVCLQPPESTWQAALHAARRSLDDQ